MLRVTVDTNILSRDLERLREATRNLDVEILPTTVTLRERGETLQTDEPIVAETGVYDESHYDSGAVYAEDEPPVVFETLVLDESRLGMAVLGGDQTPARFEIILRVIGSGSFPPPGKRDHLTGGQRRQLRDAMILEAHIRDRRDVLVSNDFTAFGGEKREKLEALFMTRIMDVDEFCAGVVALLATE